MKWLKKNWWVAGLLLALAVAVLSPLASTQPDGLERVAEDQGFIDRGKQSPLRVISDYLFPGIHDERLATILAGVVGTVVVFAVVYGVAWAVRRRRNALPSTAGDQQPTKDAKS